MASNQLSQYCHRMAAIVLLGGGLLATTPGVPIDAHAASPITSSGLNTQVSAPIAKPGGITQYDITGGTRPNNGLNLFHSFGEFGVPTNNIANLLNDSGLATSNILGRVTGGSPSNIFGTIQTQGFGNANLFLMNPAGIVFGPNATLNVGGSVHFTTADYLRLADPTGGNAGIFHANTSLASVLTTAPVAAFGFLNNNPAAIAIQPGTSLTVSDGQTISMVGGNRTFMTDAGDTVPSGVTVTGGTLTAPSGHINIASVASSGEVVMAVSGAIPTLDAGSFAQLGKIGLSLSSVDVSGITGGSIVIRGGQIVIDQSGVTAGTLATAIRLGVDIFAKESLLVDNGSQVGTLTQGSGRAGDVTITGGAVTVRNGSSVGSVTQGSGAAGDVTIATSSLLLEGGGLADTTVSSVTMGSGAAGTVSITTGDLSLIAEQGSVSIAADNLGTGKAGSVTIDAQSIIVQAANGLPAFISADSLDGSAAAGTVRVSTGTLVLHGEDGTVFISADQYGTGNAGTVDITAHTIFLRAVDQVDSFASIEAVNLGPAGDGGLVSLNTGTLELHGLAFISSGRTRPSDSPGPGVAGAIQISAGHILLDGENLQDPNTAVGGVHNRNLGSIDARQGGTIQIDARDIEVINKAEIASFSNSAPAAGDIVITTDSLQVLHGGVINSTTFGTGDAGKITVTAQDVTLSGPNPVLHIFGPGPSGQLVVTDVAITGLFAVTGLLPAKAGNIDVTTSRLQLLDGAQISTQTYGAGDGGSITVKADSVRIAGADLMHGVNSSIVADALAFPGLEAFATGKGGQIAVVANRVELSNGGAIATRTFGEGSGGTIAVQASELQLSSGAVINAETQGPGRAGDIALDVANASLEGGALITSNTFGRGEGGQVTVRATESLSLSGETPNPVTIGGHTFPHLPSTIESGAFADGQGGRIAVSAPILTMQKGNIGADTFGSGNAGVIVVNVGRLVLTEGALITAATNASASGEGGSVTVRATDSIFIDGHRTDRFPSGDIFVTNAPSGIFTNTFGAGKGGVISVSSPILTMGEGQGGGQIGAQTFGPADAGSILVEVGSLTLNNGATISGTTLGAGQGGNVTVTATDSISISGRHPGSFGFGPLIFTNTQSAILSLALATGKAGSISVSTANLSLHDEGGISAATGGAGPAGDVVVNSGMLSLTRVGQITSTSGVQIGDTFFVGDGAAGSVTVNTAGPVVISGQGSGIFTSALGNGAGGDINVHAGRIQLDAGATISASSIGLGNAGNISITADDRLVMRDSTLTTQATVADGGNITIQAGEVVQLIHGSITTSVGQGLGNGGNITIDPQFVILQNGSRILANANGGHGGNINITAGLLLISPDSDINASSALGVSGTITINSAISELSGSLTPLPQGFLGKGVLLSSRCATRVGGSNSSFVVAGREAIPMEPGGLLPSPLPESGGLVIAGSGSGLLPEVGLSARLEAGLEQGCGS